MPILNFSDDRKAAQWSAGYYVNDATMRLYFLGQNTLTGQLLCPETKTFLGVFRVPDRGSGNPTPLGGMGPARTRCTRGHGELQTRQPYGLGLKVPHCMGYEIPVRDPRRGCGATVPRARA